MNHQQLFKVTVFIDRCAFVYKGRFACIRDALDYYARRGRVIEIKEISR